jgi:DNA helicase II / ATP-dependent DNA helicase PcrA
VRRAWIAGHFLPSLQAILKPPMINTTEQEEKEYLAEIKEQLQQNIRRADEKVRQYAEELRSNKQYIFENQSGMDEADMVAADQSINRMASTGESAVSRRRKLMKLEQSPYFGRIDFTQAGKDRSAIYIGIYTFSDEIRRVNLIYDWRAPVSSMFYDFELGEASYKTPSGIITGTIDLKRQYRIRDGRMEFMIENSLNILDELLQKELSKSSDDKMKNIVATIQRDQNAIIRNEEANVMIIQGVAGSGKTSIALHRIAFLLYRFREEISSKDVLIVSPNKVFADYISNVLPELGEEEIPEITMDELARDVLQNRFVFQTFFQQVNAILQHKDDAFAERLKFKSSFEFLTKLNQYFIYLENNSFEAFELPIAGTVVPSTFIMERFKASHRMPLLKRLPEVIKDVLQYARNAAKRKLSGNEREQLWLKVTRLFKLSQNVLDLYRQFYTWIKREDMFRFGGNELEYSDVFPMIYFVIRLEGIQPYDHVKHLLVDEMQDYSPVQYAVLSRLFKCKKTILGDINQQVNPFSASSADDINRVFPSADVVKLTKSYRSTWEIANFAQRIAPNPDLIAMERHGSEPSIVGTESNVEEAAHIRKLFDDFRNSGHQSLGIICKTVDQAEFLYEQLKGPGVYLLNADSTSFKEGVIITTAHLAKGLEFDEVIVPFVSSRNYQDDVDRRMLYIACTRAMHKLTLTYAKEVSGLIH